MTHPRRPLSRSRGIATVLIMLLIGMSLTAMVMGAGHYIRSTQAQTLSTHAQTQAQMKAWTGVEIIKQYLQELQTNSKLDTLMAMATPVALTLGGEGVDNLMQASITHMDTAKKTLTVEITGLTAAGTRAEAQSVLQVIYALDGTGGTTTTASGACGAAPRASTVFKGDVNITGGTTAIHSGSAYADIAVEGSLTISNASKAIISGCTKGDINLSGGGIDDDASLSSENGKITIQSMSTPKNATLWGRDISIGNSGNGTYNAVMAGAYGTTVYAEDGTAIGTANLGGRLLASTADKSIPWTTGTVVPWTTGTVLISLNGGAQYLLDLSKATVTASTGMVSGAQAASERLQGEGQLPDLLYFKSTALRGGTVDLYTLSIKDLWGHGIDIQGWSGTYNKVRANGNFKVVTGSIASFTGGGDFWAVSGGCSSPKNCWNTPSVAGNTAGKIQYGGGKTSAGGSMDKLTEQPGISPGLPGVPFCDTRTERIDAGAYRASANYVFEFVQGEAQLTIQNVKRLKDGKVLDGVYSLKNPNTAQRAILEELMTCEYGNNKGCLQTGTSWSLSGVRNFPVGVAWFDRDVTVHGTELDLLNTIVSKGSVTLTTSGHKDLYAPNFSTPAKVCDGADRPPGAVQPTNLCTVEKGVSKFESWKDAEGKAREGLPLANMAVIAQEAMSSQGWKIDGNVSLGGTFTSGANTTQIQGAITVGANQTSHTTITQGGLEVNTRRVTQNQGYVPSSQCTPQTKPAPAAVSVRWSRYL